MHTMWADHVAAYAERLSALRAVKKRRHKCLPGLKKERACVRLAAACHMLGISARTIERWRAEPQIDDRRHGPQRRPSNALTPAEEAQVVTVLTSSRYARLSPKQLVPQLADERLYLASDSTMYRVQRRLGLRTKGPTAPRTLLGEFYTSLRVRAAEANDRSS